MRSVQQHRLARLAHNRQRQQFALNYATKPDHHRAELDRPRIDSNRIESLPEENILTLFTTAKPFDGHSGVIQRNALESWRRLAPIVEIILFGDDAGAAQICAELGLRHEPEVARNRFGSKCLDHMFQRAQQLARNDLLCYCNCDIILKQDFRAALQRVSDAHPRFLMVGRRWDTDITEPLNFTSQNWEKLAEDLARTRGVQQPSWSIDYFAFRRGLYANMPALVIGRIWWDHWLVWKARDERADVVDASQVVTAIHQNHGYGYHPQGARGVWEDQQAQENVRLAGGPWHLYTIDDATHVLMASGERKNWRRHWAPYWRHLRPRVAPSWFKVLDVTRPARRRLGLGKAPSADVGAPPAESTAATSATARTSDDRI